MPQVTQVAQIIQLALAPVFLLAGIGTFLNVCASRLARVVDRARTVERLVLETRGREHDHLVREIRTLDRRMSVVNGAILLGVLSACAICFVVILLFITSMTLQAAAFATFIAEVRLASRSMHVRHEVLYHKVEAEES